MCRLSVALGKSVWKQACGIVSKVIVRLLPGAVASEQTGSSLDSGRMAPLPTPELQSTRDPQVEGSVISHSNPSRGAYSLLDFLGDKNSDFPASVDDCSCHASELQASFPSNISKILFYCISSLFSKKEGGNEGAGNVDKQLSAGVLQPTALEPPWRSFHLELVSMCSQETRA